MRKKSTEISFLGRRRMDTLNKKLTVTVGRYQRGSRSDLKRGFTIEQELCIVVLQIILVFLLINSLCKDWSTIIFRHIQLFRSFKLVNTTVKKAKVSAFLFLCIEILCTEKNEGSKLCRQVESMRRQLDIIPRLEKKLEEQQSLLKKTNEKFVFLSRAIKDVRENSPRAFSVQVRIL